MGMKVTGVLIAAGIFMFAAAVVYGSPGGYDYGVTQQQAQASPDVKTQIKTAITHAGFAASGAALGYVQQHLGHTLNCIEGPKGKNFNASWGNVCEGQGSGILVDLKAAPGGAALMPDAEKADTMALAGLKTKNLDEAKTAAKGVADTLNGVLGKLK
jgi:hypothetical protein